MKPRVFSVLSAALLLLCACDGAKPKAQVAPPHAAIPAALFAAADFADGAAPIAQLKKTAKVGDTVVIRGRVGGSREPFVEGAASMTLVDPAQPIVCGPDDACRTKWDYCCEPNETLLPHLATVKAVDAAGLPIMASFKGAHGLAEFHLLTVRGKVLSCDGKNLVVAPEALFDAGFDGDGKKTGTPVRGMEK